MSDIPTLLDELDTKIAEFSRTPIPEEHIPDTVGRLRFIGKRAYEIAKGLLVETDVAPKSPAKGKAYDLVASREAKRTYNTARLLNEFATATQRTVLATFMDLVERKVIKVEWGWLRLKEAAATDGVTLMIEPNLVIEADTATLDTAHVGEMWDTKVAVTKSEGEGT